MEGPARSAFPGEILNSAAGAPSQPHEYTSHHGHVVVGIGEAVPDTEWSVVAEKKKTDAYADIARVGKLTILIVGFLLITMGGFAYLLAQTIVKPLKRLSKEAGQVASGDLQVEIPVHGTNEVSYLTQLFNHMVSSLRQGQAQISQAHEALIEKNRELHQLSITDGLTGLFNRKHLMDLFDMEFIRAQRYQTPFSVLIADLDHFKTINDTHGHLAGDSVLRRIADTLGQSIRECDHVGRYGGEEFLIILPDTRVDGAMQMGERIRQIVSEVSFYNDGEAFSMTLSVGVATCSQADSDLEAILSRADEALYRAKANGRNQVIGP